MDEDDDARWFAALHQYRPFGNGAEEFFADFPNTDEYIRRFRMVAKAAYHETWDTDAYFTVRNPIPSTDEDLVSLGWEFLEGLRPFADLIDYSDDPELRDYLHAVSEVVVVPAGSVDPSNDDNLIVYDRLGDAIINLDRDEVVELRREAFYSVACDYELAHFLTWPSFAPWMTRDVYRPHFELWARCANHNFEGRRLCIERVDNRSKRQ